MKSKVLVVDDDPAIRRLLRRILGEAGHEVIEADDADLTLDLVARQRPALVLMDMHMPRLDGIAAIAELKDVDPELPIIMLTGDAEPRRASLAMERGACDFIQKPFERKHLEGAVTAHLMARRRL